LTGICPITSANMTIIVRGVKAAGNNLALCLLLLEAQRIFCGLNSNWFMLSNPLLILVACT
jgi:hypothetical protein